MKVFIRSKIEKHVEYIESIKVTLTKDFIQIDGDFSYVFGLGERFQSINQKGYEINHMVEEQFCNQGLKTYLPISFFFLKEGFGCFINSKRVFKIDVKKHIFIDFKDLEEDLEIFLFKGNPKEIIRDFMSLNQKTHMPPKWVFGPWMSAHRWKSQQMITEQLETIETLELPFSALVIEQWSDEATFYVFNKASYEKNVKGLPYEAYDFSQSLWPDPKGMIDHMHNQGIHLILWQAPVIKGLESHEPRNEQHEMDQNYIVEHELMLKNKDGSPYLIPNGKWFNQSMVPDFENPKLVDWWFDKRKYLFDIGVDGFKTDGGEFIHQKDMYNYKNIKGDEMINDYAYSYIKAYHQNTPDACVCFSRAGTKDNPSVTLQWSGDQKSTWEELRSMYYAGITSSLSGITFWGFDIGGFAGDLPSMDLYLSATHMALFSPIMQFHSEPIGGQFALLDPSKVMNNERSPWQMMAYHQRNDLLTHFQNVYWMRMNLLPYIYSEAHKAVKHKTTLMRHMMIDFFDDPCVYDFGDQYMFADILVKPILEPNAKQAMIYFPKGTWRHIMNDEKFEGNKVYHLDSNEQSIHAFIRDGSALALDLNGEKKYPSKITKYKDKIDLIDFWLFGEKGSHHYIDQDNDFIISWADGVYHIHGTCTINYNIWFK